VRKGLLTIAVVAVYLLHQDVWFWRTAQPLIFGFLPVGLAYHGAYSILAALLLWLLTTYAWPHRLEEEAERGADGDGGRR